MTEGFLERAYTVIQLVTTAAVAIHQSHLNSLGTRRPVSKSRKTS